MRLQHADPLLPVQRKLEYGDPGPGPPNAANDSSYYTRMLALPDGQVLFNDGSNQMEVYTAGGSRSRRGRLRSRR